jgi:hypothetical protein
MDFVERWFGISPDNGNGSFEFLCVLVAIAGTLLFLGRRRVAKLGRRASGRTDH